MINYWSGVTEEEERCSLEHIQKLKAALLEARGWLQYGLNTYRLDPTSDVPDVIDRINTAIAKAEGRS